ncbi:chemotaxis protein CheA [Aquabacterium lacunae]|uniref:Chemotaxis protein CheA n=1 Tax=Aquabacterium lacunae TaxID=2528630 RepID=A0A4Q9GZP1_9BURK|nr:chemotaxis protein CheA [Aquabacterium lacunae]TBO31514.1 chemotaxis protein CheA [Aquabacterium lacunae]
MNQTELLDQFILEARECLEGIGQRLLQVEKDPTNGELLNDLFRLVHTLKGNCGLFEFKPLERVVHAGEDLLDRVRNQTLSYNDQIADALLEAMDFTALMVDEIEAKGSIDPAADGRSQALAASLRAHLDGSAAKVAASMVASASMSTAASEPVATMPAAAPRPDWADRWPEALETQHPQAVAVRYRPEPECFFKGEDPWNLVKLTPGLVHLDVATVEPWPATDALDCYRCNLDFVLVCDAPLAYVQEHFRYVPEQVDCLVLAEHPRHVPMAVDLASSTPAEPAAAEPVQDPQARVREVARKRVLQLWNDQIMLLKRPGLGLGTLAAVRRALSGLLSSLSDDDALQQLASLTAMPPQASAAQVATWAQQNPPVGGGADLAATAGAGGGDAGARKSGLGSGEEGNHHGNQKVLKVGQEKIDRLMDLIGEMVVAKNALPYLAQRAEQVFQQRELAREIKAQYAVINRIAEDMQHAIMQVRMLPVGTVFQRFGRLVRDISKKLGKDVSLEIEGEETEADKNVIEALADPLIHILRNSLDHGIEMPEARRAAGKQAQGSIKVLARQESDRVIIEIIDDGAGIDPNRIRNKAVERGLIPADKAHSLTDHEAVQLIFLPGFSTAEQISDLSGRGVGMDVVRTAVERINGTVQLSSVHGKGTTIRLSLPLSMAVTNVMIIEVGGRRFGVPMDMIVETVRVHVDDIHKFKQASTTVLRGRIVPLKSLHELLALDEPAQINEEGETAVLVVRLLGEHVGLLVDQFHGASDIILKPLEGVLSGLTGFAGTALMGDGSVLMVLNPKELL